MVKTECFFPKIRKSQGCQLSPLLLNIRLNRCCKPRKRNKHADWKVRTKPVCVYVYIYNLIIYVENPKYSTKKKIA